MKIENNSIVTPLPTDELIEAFENDSRVELPQDYKLEFPTLFGNYI